MQILAVQRRRKIHRPIWWSSYAQQHVVLVVRTFKNMHTFPIYYRFHLENLENILEDSWGAGCRQCKNGHMRKELAKDAQFFVVWADARLVRCLYAQG
jgi:hypothetical protein